MLGFVVIVLLFVVLPWLASLQTQADAQRNSEPDDDEYDIY